MTDLGKFLQTCRLVNKQTQPHTHTSFAEGIVTLSVSTDSRPNFYKSYLDYVICHGLDFAGLNSITERIGTVFPLFLDVDFKLDSIEKGIFTPDEIVQAAQIVVQYANQVVSELYDNQYEAFVAHRLSYKLHLHYPNIFVTKKEAKIIYKRLLEALNTAYPNKMVPDQKNPARQVSIWNTVLDISVYNTGLRMLWSHKGNMKRDNATLEVELHNRYFPNEPYHITYHLLGPSTEDGSIVRKTPCMEDLQLVSIYTTETQPTVMADAPDSDMEEDTVASSSSRVRPPRIMESTQKELESLPMDSQTKIRDMIISNLSEKVALIADVEEFVALPCGKSQIYRATLTPTDCPFAQRAHTRTSERGQSALYVMVKPQALTLSCWSPSCAGKHLDLCELDDETQDKVFKTTPIERLARKSLFHQTHEYLTELMLEMLKDRHATSPNGVSSGSTYTWYNYQQHLHRWVPGETAFKEIMHPNGIIQHTIGEVVKTLKASEESQDQQKAIDERWFKLQANLQHWPHVSASLLPLLARKLHHHWSFAQRCFSERLDENPRLIGCPNGVIDLGSKEFRAGKPEDLISKTTGVNYLPFDMHPVSQREDLESMLLKIHPDKGELPYVLQQMALGLNGTPLYQRFNILTGYGSNGKSTLVRLINLSLGEYAGEVDVTLFTRPRPPSNNPTEDLMSIRGKRFIVCNEPNAKDSIYLGTLKWLSGGDRVTGRGLREKQQSFYPQCTFYMLCNEIPQIHASQQEYGTWRRINLWLFSNRFVLGKPTQPNEHQADPELEKKMVAWKEIFLSLLVKFYYEPNSFEKPPKFAELERQLRTKNDIYARFFTDYVQTKTDQYTLCSTMFKLFTEWVRSYRISRDVPYDVFERQMIPLLGEPVDVEGAKCWQAEVIMVRY